MKIGAKILAGYLTIIALISVMVWVNYSTYRGIADDITQLREVEVPLEFLVEQVKSYDAILTEQAYTSLLHAQTGKFDEIEEHKKIYDEVEEKFDSLIKNDAKALLDRSNRETDDKIQVKYYLAKIDEINAKVLQLEDSAYKSMDEKDPIYAYSKLVEGNYPIYKQELNNIYEDWAALEKRVTKEDQNIIIEKTVAIIRFNLMTSFALVLLALLVSYLASVSISKPLQKLRNDVDEISKGKIDLQLGSSKIAEIQNLTDSLNRVLASMKLAILRTGLTKSDIGLIDSPEEIKPVKKKKKK
jgi:methyl-accepting chemotaxis protein